MNREKVIELARECTAPEWRDENGGAWHMGLDLERFAALVAAHERQKHLSDIEAWKAKAAESEKWRAMALAKDPMQPGKAVQEIQQEAAKKEREACAVLAEDRFFGNQGELNHEIAAAIRARGGDA